MGRSASRTRLLAVAAGASLLTAGALGGIAISAPQGPDGVIHACFNQAALDSDHSSEIVLVNAGDACPAGWPQPIAWNAAGVAGQTGPKGEPGVEGKPGAKGEPGVEGKPGTKGEAGATPLPKQKEEEILKQSKADDAKAKKIDGDLDKLQDKLRDLDLRDPRDLLLLQQLLSKWAMSSEILAEIVRRQGQQTRDYIGGASVK